MPSKLTQAARDDIELQLEAGTRVDIIANTFHISQSQVYKMRDNMRHFGRVAPDPAAFQVQGRPRLVTAEAREGVLDFLLDHGKLAYIDEVKFYLKDEWDIVVSPQTAHRLIRSLEMTKKAVSLTCLTGRLRELNLLMFWLTG
jgi:transposase